MKSEPLRLAVDALAVYRITRLIYQDDITGPLRERVYIKFGDESFISELIRCPWCVSVWVAGGVAVADGVLPKAWEKAARPLALAAAAGIIAHHVNYVSRKIETEEQKTLDKDARHLFTVK